MSGLKRTKWFCWFGGLLVLSLSVWLLWRQDFFYVRAPAISTPEDRAQPARPPDPIPEIELLRCAYRDAFKEIWRFSLIGGVISLLCMAIVAYVLIYQPREIPSAKPFDPEKERRRPKNLRYGG